MARPPEGAWYGRSDTHYTTRGADVFLAEGGWYARCGRKVRGPISNLDAAMQAADAMMLADAKREEAHAPAA